jgi:malonyl-CoA/methylmalonyl-CoA synthetase
MAADGRVTLVGRARDLIISGGLNVYPREVEAALDALPGVRESAVIGVPHPDLGEGVTAVVVPDGSQAVTAADVRAALAGRLAGFKQPKQVFVIEALPRNAMGKVQKSVLRTRFAGAYAGS